MVLHLYCYITHYRLYVNVWFTIYLEERSPVGRTFIPAINLTRFLKSRLAFFVGKGRDVVGVHDIYLFARGDSYVIIVA